MRARWRSSRRKPSVWWWATSDLSSALWSKPSSRWPTTPVTFADRQRWYHSIKKERQAIEQLIRHRCAALVVHAKMIPDDELAGLMKQIPGMVLINRILAGFEQRCVAWTTATASGWRPVI